MAKGNGAAIDPWCVTPVETATIEGIKVTITGLTIGEASRIAKANKDDQEAVTAAFIAACCKRSDGVELTPEMVRQLRPAVFLQLNEIINRVNGIAQGN